MARETGTPVHDLSRGGREFALVRGDLLGVVLAVAPVNHFVARQGGGMEFAFRRGIRSKWPPVSLPRARRAHIRTLPVSRQCAGM